MTGLDIGTGSSAIYPLLGCSSNDNWTFFATDIDSHSLSYAEQNIDRNGLQSRIHLRRSTIDSNLIPLTALGVDHLDFVMCNPPFYGSEEDMDRSSALKGSSPSAICTGAEVEMICPGGDAGFVLRMVEESTMLGEMVTWYSSMLGKLGSVGRIVARLKEAGCTSWGVHVLRAGNKTKRWVVIWTWTGQRGRNDLMRSAEVNHTWLPRPTTQTIKLKGNISEFKDKLASTMEGIDGQLHWTSPTEMTIQTSGNTWARSARRRKARQEDTTMSEVEEAIGFAARNVVTADGIVTHWLFGKDHVVFESYCGMLKRSMTT